MIDYGDTVFAGERLRMKQKQRQGRSGTVAANGNSPEGSAVTTSQATVLVIDDSDAMADVLTDLLEHFDCDVISALNAPDGLTAFEQNRDKVALVILDMNMPLMDGAEALAKLRRINLNVPVIVSSSITEAEARRRCSEQGQDFSYYLAKPYTLDRARQMIGEALRR